MKALIIVDAQYDFMPGGALAVSEGDEIIPVINKMIPQVDLVVATQDWHPADHLSFASQHKGRQPFDIIKLKGQDQVLWPDHCIQGSRGAEIHEEIDQHAIEAVFRKGMDREIDSYSGFYDNNHERTTGLAGYLREKGAKELYFCGLAADVCVFYSLKDSLDEGFYTILVKNGTRAINDDAFTEQLQVLEHKGLNIQVR